MLPSWRDALLRRPWALWLALLLAVVSALSPTLSHGLAADHGSAMALQDICASNAPDSIAISTPTPPTRGTGRRWNFCGPSNSWSAERCACRSLDRTTSKVAIKETTKLSKRKDMGRLSN